MTFLLDTHVAVWTVMNRSRLPASFIPLLQDTENELVYSVVNLWEIAVKAGTRKSFDVDAARLRRSLLQTGCRELPVEADHAMQVGILPLIHKDPFDRLLIAQAQIEFMTLMTVDADIMRYPNVGLASF